MRRVFSVIKQDFITKTDGFSLIEVSITLAILGVLAAASLSLYADKKQVSYHSITKERQDIIFKSLANYALRYGYFPCPASKLDGLEDKNCSKAKGYIPFVALGLSEKNAHNAHKVPFQYEIALEMTKAHVPSPVTSLASPAFYADHGIDREKLQILCKVSKGLSFSGSHIPPSRDDPVAVILSTDGDHKSLSTVWRTRDNLFSEYAHFSCPAYLATYFVSPSPYDSGIPIDSFHEEQGPEDVSSFGTSLPSMH